LDRDAQQVTLLLNGWTAVRFRGGAMFGWGMRHVEYGDVREDFFNKAHGPTVAPLIWYRKVEGITTPGDEIPFDAVPLYTFGRLWNWWLVGMPVEKHDGTF
jgi:hypothetical protein